MVCINRQTEFFYKNIFYFTPPKIPVNRQYCTMQPLTGGKNTLPQQGIAIL